MAFYCDFHHNHAGAALPLAALWYTDESLLSELDINIDEALDVGRPRNADLGRDIWYGICEACLESIGYEDSEENESWWRRPLEWISNATGCSRHVGCDGERCSEWDIPVRVDDEDPCAPE